MLNEEIKLDDLTENEFQVGRFLWEDDIRVSNNDTDEYIQDEIIDYYVSGDITPDTIRKMSHIIEEREEKLKYYGSYLELDDTPVFNQIRTKNDIPEKALDSFQQFVGAKEDEYIAACEKEIEQKLYFLGRSGKHACVETDFRNIMNYFTLQDTYKKYQKEMMEDIYENWAG